MDTFQSLHAILNDDNIFVKFLRSGKKDFKKWFKNFRDLQERIRKALQDLGP